MAAPDSLTPESYTTESSYSSSSLPNEYSLAPTPRGAMREKSPTRLKRAHNKVRSGCITCRRRRVKCDEARPKCERCIKADRACEGYKESSSYRSDQVKPYEPTLLSKAPHTSDLILCLNSVDMIYPFEHYLEEAASHMSLMFVSMLNGTPEDKLQVLDLARRSRTLWCITIPTICQSEPTLQYAVAALSSLHKWLLKPQQPIGQNADFARFYSRAVSAVNMIADNSSSSIVLTLLSCLIFAQCEVLMACHDNAALHIRSGLSIINNLRASSQGSLPPVIDDCIEPIFDAHLTLQNAPFPELDFEWQVCQDPVQRLIPALPASFMSIAQAGECLQEVMYRALLLQELSDTVDKRFIMAVRRLANEWSTTFDLFRCSSIYGSATEHLLLLAHHRMIQLLLKTMPPEQDEHYRDAEHDFRVILSQMQSYWSCSLDLASNSSSLGLITPLFFVATQAPHDDLRIAALDMLADLHICEGHWTSCVAHAIASRTLKLYRRLEVSVQGTHSKDYQSFSHQARLRLDRVERLQGMNALKLTYHVQPTDSQDSYAMTDVVKTSPCVDKCDLEWPADRVIAYYGFQGGSSRFSQPLAKCDCAGGL